MGRAADLRLERVSFRDEVISGADEFMVAFWRRGERNFSMQVQDNSGVEKEVVGRRAAQGPLLHD